MRKTNAPIWERVNAQPPELAVLVKENIKISPVKYKYSNGLKIKWLLIGVITSAVLSALISIESYPMTAVVVLVFYLIVRTGISNFKPVRLTSADHMALAGSPNSRSKYTSIDW